MSTDFERFIAGEGRLAGVLRAQPGFEPPVGMEARLFAALDALDSHDTVAGFEPPAQLEAAVMAEAERLDAAQRPRRDALIAAAAQDDPSINELGPAAQRWLRAQATTPPDSPKASRRVRRSPWLARAGGAVAALLALGVAVQLWFDPQASRVTQEADSELAASVPPASPAPRSAVDATRSAPAEAGPQRETKRADFTRERSESRRQAPPIAAMENGAGPAGGLAAPMAKAEASRPSAEAARAQIRQHVPRDAPRALSADRKAREAPRSPSAAAASPKALQRSPIAAPTPAPLERFAGSAQASTDAAAPVAKAGTSEAQVTRQVDDERGATLGAVRFTLPLTTSTDDFVARISAYAEHHWQVSATPADRPVAQTLIDNATRQLAGTGRRDRFAVVEKSRATGTLEVASQP